MAQFTWYTTPHFLASAILSDQERSDGVDGLVVGANIVVAENVGELFRQTADVRETNTDLGRRWIVIRFSFRAAFRRFEDPLFVSVGVEG